MKDKICQNSPRNTFPSNSKTTLKNSRDFCHNQNLEHIISSPSQPKISLISSVKYNKLKTPESKRIWNSTKNQRSKISRIQVHPHLFSTIKKWARSSSSELKCRYHSKQARNSRNRRLNEKSINKSLIKIHNRSHERLTLKYNENWRSRNRGDRIGISNTSYSHSTGGLGEKSWMQNTHVQNSMLSPREWIKKIDRQMNRTIKLSRINLYQAWYPKEES